jgi:hypothetical protein
MEWECGPSPRGHVRWNDAKFVPFFNNTSKTNRSSDTKLEKNTLLYSTYCKLSSSSSSSSSESRIVDRRWRWRYCSGGSSLNCWQTLPRQQSHHCRAEYKQLKGKACRYSTPADITSRPNGYSVSPTHTKISLDETFENAQRSRKKLHYLYARIFFRHKERDTLYRHFNKDVCIFLRPETTLEY